jgi:hypothetical protein
MLWLFDTIIVVGKNDNPYSREQGTKIFLLRGAKTDINKLLAKEIEKRKNYRYRGYCINRI